MYFGGRENNGGRGGRIEFGNRCSLMLNIDLTTLPIHRCLAYRAQPYLGGDSFCNIHPRKHIIMYYEGCEEAVCKACIGGQHKGHDIIELREAAQECKKWLSESIIAMTQQDNLCVEENTALKNDTEEVIATANNIITQVRRNCAALCQELKASTEEVVTDLTKQCEEIKSGNNTKMEKNNMLSSRLRNSIARHHVFQETKKYLSVIQGKQNLEPQVNQLRKEEPESLEEKIRWNLIPGALNTASSWYLVGRLEKKDELKQIPGALDIGTDKNKNISVSLPVQISIRKVRPPSIND